MGKIETKTFMSGNSVAVELPDELGIAPGTLVRIEKVGSTLTIVPAGPADPEKNRSSNQQLVAALRALGPIKPPGRREPIDFPDRHGLYD